MPKKILFILHGFNIGGTEMIVSELATFFSKDYDISILALDRSGSLESRLQEAGIKTKVLHRQPGLALSNFTNFNNFIRELKPDLVHAHQYTPFFYAAMYKLISFQKFKLIFTEHGRHFPDVVSWRRKAANYLLFKVLDRITAVCNFTRSALVKNEMPGCYKVEVIYNGTNLIVPMKRSLKKIFNISEDRQIIGYIGSFRQVKNPEMAINAFKIVSQKLQNTHLVMIGSGELDSTLIELAKNLSLQERITFTGDLLPAKEYMQDINVLIQPSLCEAQSLALLDAMALGIPAVINTYGGGPEVIKNGYNGYLIDEQRPELYAEKLIACLSDSSQQTFLSVNAKKCAEDFSMTRMIEKYHNLYRELGI